MTFSTRNSSRDTLLSQYVRQFSLWAGNMMGNSPSSVSCLFETTFYSQAVSLMDPPVPTDGGGVPDLHVALRYQLDLFVSTQIDSNGVVTAQWSEHGSNPGGYAGNLIQQQTQLLNAVYLYATQTGDRDFINKHWNGPLKRALYYLLHELGVMSTGLSHCTGNATGNVNSTAACTWMDIIDMGGAVGLLNAEALQTLSGYSDMAAWLGDVETAELLDSLYERSKTVFLATYWNESAQLFADWVGEDGARHTFAYLWTQGLAADIFTRKSSNNKEQQQHEIKRMQRVAASVDRLYEKARVEDNLDFFMTPTNLLSVPCDLQPSWCQQYGVYENGAAFPLQSYFELLLRTSTGQSGQNTKAIALVDRILEQFAEHRCWGQHYSWGGNGDSKRGFWNGGDVLTDAVMMAVGLLRGATRVRPTLTQGIVIDGAPGAEFEGWMWTFWYKGRRWEARVVDGETQLKKKNTKQ